MKYAEAPHDGGDATCKDPECPCGDPGVAIPRGTGYLYISKEFVEYRRNCLTLEELLAKHRAWSLVTFASAGIDWPILVCELGARRRGLDLEVAAADAKHWWNTGLVPLRVTPTLKGAPVSAEEKRYSSGEPKSTSDASAPYQSLRLCQVCGNKVLFSASGACPICGENVSQPSTDRPVVRELVLFSDRPTWDNSLVASTAKLLKSSLARVSLDSVDDSKVRIWQIPGPTQVYEALKKADNETAYLRKVMAMCIARKLGTPEVFNYVATVYAIKTMEDILRTEYGFDRTRTRDRVIYQFASTQENEFYFALVLDRHVNHEQYFFGRDSLSMLLCDLDSALGGEIASGGPAGVALTALFEWAQRGEAQLAQWAITTVKALGEASSLKESEQTFLLDQPLARSALLYSALGRLQTSEATQLAGQIKDLYAKRGRKLTAIGGAIALCCLAYVGLILLRDMNQLRHEFDALDGLLLPASFIIFPIGISVTLSGLVYYLRTKMLMKQDLALTVLHEPLPDQDPPTP